MDLLAVFLASFLYPVNLRRVFIVSLIRFKIFEVHKLLLGSSRQCFAFTACCNNHHHSKWDQVFSEQPRLAVKVEKQMRKSADNLTCSDMIYWPRGMRLNTHSCSFLRENNWQQIIEFICSHSYLGNVGNNLLVTPQMVNRFSGCKIMQKTEDWDYKYYAISHIWLKLESPIWKQPHMVYWNLAPIREPTFIMGTTPSPQCCKKINKAINIINGLLFQ